MAEVRVEPYTISIQLSFASDVLFMVAELDICFNPASLLRASTILREWFGRSNVTSFQQGLHDVTYRCNSRVAIEHLACEAKSLLVPGCASDIILRWILQSFGS